MGYLRDVRTFWRTIVVVLTPLLFLPLPIAIPTSEAKCAYGLILMAVYWMTEALPIPVTALLPAVIFPLMGVMSSKEICKNYMKDINMLFLGGLMVAVAIESCNLHKRVALFVLRIVGSNPRSLLLGFMLPTWFLSMWISNTATTAMMIPVAQAVLQQLGKKDGEELDGQVNEAYLPTETETVLNNSNANDKHIERTDPEKGSYMQQFTETLNDRGQVKTAEDKELKMEDHQYENTCKCLLLCVAYAANVGGTGSITGTGPNLVLKGISEDVFTRHGLAGPINFTSWFIYGLPASVICLILTWIWLQVLFLRCRFAEIEVGCLFVILAFLWLFRKPEFIPGWGSLLAQRSFATDSTPALFIAIVLFALPSKRPEILCWRPKDGNAVSHPAVLEWEPAVKKFPWGIVLLLGGGFALADACQKSGLSQLLGDQLVIFNEIPSWALQMIVTTLVAALTEVTSNTATATILLPIMAGLAESTGKNPLFLMLPTTLACSYAFMLPVATPPNAIAFAYGHLRVVDMAKTGLMLNILCILVATLATHTWGMAYFKLDVLPWTDVNVTTIQPTTTAGMFTT